MLLLLAATVQHVDSPPACWQHVPVLAPCKSQLYQSTCLVHTQSRACDASLTPACMYCRYTVAEIAELQNLRHDAKPQRTTDTYATPLRKKEVSCYLVLYQLLSCQPLLSWQSGKRCMLLLATSLFNSVTHVLSDVLISPGSIVAFGCSHLLPWLSGAEATHC